MSSKLVAGLAVALGAGSALAHEGGGAAAPSLAYLPLEGRHWSTAFFCATDEQDVHYHHHEHEHEHGEKDGHEHKHHSEPLSITLACENPHDTINHILFAGYGAIDTKTCQNMRFDGKAPSKECASPHVTRASVEKECMGKSECTVTTYGLENPCPGTRKALAIKAMCEGAGGQRTRGAQARLASLPPPISLAFKVHSLELSADGALPTGFVTAVQRAIANEYSVPPAFVTIESVVSEKTNAVLYGETAARRLSSAKGSSITALISSSIQKRDTREHPAANLNSIVSEIGQATGQSQVTSDPLNQSYSNSASVTASSSPSPSATVTSSTPAICHQTVIGDVMQTSNSKCEVYPVFDMFYEPSPSSAFYPELKTLKECKCDEDCLGAFELSKGCAVDGIADIPNVPTFCYSFQSWTTGNPTLTSNMATAKVKIPDGKFCAEIQELMKR